MATPFGPPFLLGAQVNKDCKTCRYYKFIDKDMGECRRLPPKSPNTTTPGVQWLGTFTLVRPDWWCGEYDMTREPISTYEVRQ